MAAIRSATTDPFLRFTLEDNGCWLWTGPKKWNGYGFCMIGSRTDGTRCNKYAHRLFYEVLVGPIPTDFDIDHLCRCRLCVNPSHLEAVPRRVNLERSKRPTCPKGHNDFRYRNGRRRCNLCYPINGIQNSLKTHCPRGHTYDIVQKDGSRRCSVCHAIQSRESYWRHKCETT